VELRRSVLQADRTVKVLHVIPALAARYGGPSAAVLGMSRATRSVGVSTLIATTDADGPTRLAVTLARPVDYHGVPAIFFRRTFSESFKYSSMLARWVSRHVSDYDVVHIHAVFSHSSVAAAAACRRQGIPYLVRPLGTLDPWSLRRRRILKLALLQLAVHKMLSGAAAVHFTSDEELRLAESELPGMGKGIVVPLGIDDVYFAESQSSREEGPYVLSLSRLHPKKGVELLIQAFHDLQPFSESAAWKLVIAGDGEPAYVARLRRLAEEGAGRGHIVFRGWVDGDDKLTLLRGASVFALVSHQENFGISVAEAMACGVPALVSSGVNLAADVRRAEAGWVVDRSHGAIVQRLRDVMGNQPDRVRRGEAAREWVGRFRWPLVANQLTDMYAKVAVPRLPVLAELPLDYGRM